jgi:hypothetical protein
MRMLVTIAGLVAFSATGLAGENCQCVYKGGRVKEGQTACISTANGPELARCGKFLNNTSWIRLGKSCTPQQTSENPQNAAKTQVSEKTP